MVGGHMAFTIIPHVHPRPLPRFGRLVGRDHDTGGAESRRGGLTATAARRRLHQLTGGGKTVKKLRVAAVVAALMIAAAVAFATHSGRSAAQRSSTAPIGPRTAAALGMAFAPATSKPGITASEANRAALAGWPHCTTGGTTAFR